MNEEEEIRFIDLFGGIGGFRLGLERANRSSSQAQIRESSPRIQFDEQHIRNKGDKSDSSVNRNKGEINSGVQERADNNRGFLQEKEKAEGIQGNSSITKKRQNWIEGGNSNKGRSDNTEKSRKTDGNKRRRDVHVEKCSSTFRCVWYCDKDKYAVQTYNKNFKEKYKPTDIKTVKTKDIPDFDMLCAGFPCQSFSVAGKRKGFQDIRGTMFYEICRIAQAKRPRLLFLENVKGLLSADDGRCFATVLSSLDELGYNCEWQVLNSKNFGVPQNRERVFIIGHLRGESGRQIFPLRICNGENEIKRIGHMQGFRRYNQTYNKEGIVEALDTSGGGGHQPCVPVPMILSRPHGFNKGKAKNKVNMRFSSIQNETVNGIRRLTPIECERLQGFPDNWTKYGTSANGETIAISDTQRYKMCGNAVTVTVIEAIGKEIYKTYKDQIKLDTKEVQ